ncbi:hypothetical protein AMTR_s00024p00153040 [Amborella trichopoda]|uniref:Uncharacterized protein n=1 Tax=Amborella trichopoda TaxID=13333 RepID=W1PM55_AMBTC|nr:hypothetical protein AMTR_s00024p00153040 [Amborella trichopoda]
MGSTGVCQIRTCSGFFEPETLERRNVHKVNLLVSPDVRNILETHEEFQTQDYGHLFMVESLSALTR